MREPDRAADRLVYFSDAVVAIAITLLILPLVDLVPAALERHESTREVLLGNLGSIVAFVLSFVVIARFWVSHHQLFDGVERVNGAVVWVDMLWLLTVVVLPFPTALTGGSGTDPFTARLYVGALMVNVLTLTGLAWLVRRTGGVSDERGTAALEGIGASAALLVVAFLVLLVMPHPSYLVLLVLFASGLLEKVWRAWRRRRASSTGAAR